MDALKRKQQKKFDGNQKISYDVPYIQFLGSNRIKRTHTETHNRCRKLLFWRIISIFSRRWFTQLCCIGADVLWTYFNTFVCSALPLCVYWCVHVQRELYSTFTRVFACIVHTYMHVSVSIPWPEEVDVIAIVWARMRSTHLTFYSTLILSLESCAAFVAVVIVVGHIPMLCTNVHSLFAPCTSYTKYT